MTPPVPTSRPAAPTRGGLGVGLAIVAGALAGEASRGGPSDRFVARVAALASTNDEATRALRADAKAISDKVSALAASAARTPRERAAALIEGVAIYFSRDDTFADRALAEKRAGEIAALLKTTDLSLRVVGYTDSSGNDRKNALLGLQRAEVVAALLVAQGLDRARLRTMNRAAENLSADPRDRRVTFELAPTDEPRP